MFLSLPKVKETFGRFPANVLGDGPGKIGEVFELILDAWDHTNQPSEGSWVKWQDIKINLLKGKERNLPKGFISFLKKAKVQEPFQIFG